jgi:flagellar export protein FliJ
VPRFVFNLEAALEQRRRVERERQLAVAKIEAARVKLDERVKTVQARLVQERDDMRSLLGPRGTGVGQVSVNAVRLQATAGLHGLAELRTLAIELAGVLRRLETARTQLTVAAVARKAVEKLREQQLARWKAEQAHRESAELDDLTLMRWGNGSNAEDPLEGAAV